MDSVIKGVVFWAEGVMIRIIMRRKNNFSGHDATEAWLGENNTPKLTAILNFCGFY